MCEDMFLDSINFIKAVQADTENIAKSAGYDASRIGKIVAKRADCVNDEVVLCVLVLEKSCKNGESRKKADTEYVVRHTEITMPCATSAEAVVAFAGLQKGFYVAFDDSNELLAVLSGSFNE